MNNYEDSRIKILIVLKINKRIGDELRNSFSEINNSILEMEIIFPITMIKLLSINIF